MYADLKPGAHPLSNQMPWLPKASRSLSIVLATLLQMDKMRLWLRKKKVTLVVWLLIEYFTVLTLIIYTDIRFTEYSVLHHQNSQSENNNITRSQFLHAPHKLLSTLFSGQKLAQPTGFSWAKSSFAATGLASNQALTGQYCEVLTLSHSLLVS